jgi:hypothetical protein
LISVYLYQIFFHNKFLLKNISSSYEFSLLEILSILPAVFHTGDVTGTLLMDFTTRLYPGLVSSEAIAAVITARISSFNLPHLLYSLINTSCTAF